MTWIEKGGWHLSGAVWRITLRRFDEDERPPDYAGDSKSYARAVLQWWSKAPRQDTAEKFARSYGLWKTLEAAGQAEEARRHLSRIRNLGVAALPAMVEKIEKGDQALIPLMAELTRGKVDPNASPAQCVSWWEQNKEQWLISFPNGRPMAKPGPDRTAVTGETVRLDGSGSMDPDGDQLSYHWHQVSGPPVILSDTSAATPTFTAPKVRRQVTLVFRLVVSDAGDISRIIPTPNSRSDPVTVRITVVPKK